MWCASQVNAEGDRVCATRFAGHGTACMHTTNSGKPIRCAGLRMTGVWPYVSGSVWIADEPSIRVEFYCLVNYL